MLAKWEFRQQDRDPEAEPEAFEALVEKLRVECEAEGNEVRELGGLYIIGTERHESRRIDNQLRGRAGRQGDPGASRFYLSLEDDLMRIFAGDRVKNLMERMGMPDNEPIEHPMVTKSIENAQKKVEERNFDIRKNVLEYDDVMNSQRKTIYDLRQSLLLGRYTPEIVDEDGKPTGDKRTIKPRKKIVDEVTPVVGSILGMYLSDPLSPLDKDGEPRKVTRKDFEGKGLELVELDDLKRILYAGSQAFPGWGILTDFTSKAKKPAEAYDELVELAPLALTEQRERILDLMDRIIGAMVEESCPPAKPPEDWDWGGIFEGMKETFGIELEDDIADYGDPESLANHLYELAEKRFEAKEEEIGWELVLKAFRHVYLEELDKAWVDHLNDMEHLRDGIGLRGYGQKDPKQEYKKEGYNIFVGMVARVSQGVMSKLMTKLRIERAEDERRIEENDLLRHAQELAMSIARHDEPLPTGADEGPPPEQEPALAGDMECPCGSGKPFAKCHGADEAEEDSRSASL